MTLPLLGNYFRGGPGSTQAAPQKSLRRVSHFFPNSRIVQWAENPPLINADYQLYEWSSVPICGAAPDFRRILWSLAMAPCDDIIAGLLFPPGNCGQSSCGLR